MKTQVSILHHDYPGRLRELVEEKLGSLEKFFGHVISMRANLERQNDAHRIELVANVGGGSVLVADVSGDTFATVLDEAVDRMSRQLKRHHDKLTVDRHRGGSIGR